MEVLIVLAIGAALWLWGMVYFGAGMLAALLEILCDCRDD